MNGFKTGVIVDSFRKGFEGGLREAQRLGFDGVQVYTVKGEMAPENMTPEKIREARVALRAAGLAVSAVCGDLGGHGFTRKDENKWKIEKSKRIAELARELGTDVVTTHVGVVNADPQSEERKILAEACEEIGAYAENVGVRFAIETGPEKADTLKSFLDSLSCRTIGVNLDPANFVMVAGQDPAEAVALLKDYIVHTHVKDGVMLKQTDPKIIYDFFAEGGIGDLRIDDYFRETPLGQGSVDFPAYFGALKTAGYRGFLTIEREVGENPVRDIAEGLAYMRSVLGESRPRTMRR